MGRRPETPAAGLAFLAVLDDWEMPGQKNTAFYSLIRNQPLQPIISISAGAASGSW